MKIAFLCPFESWTTGWQAYGCLYVINIIEYLSYFNYLLYYNKYSHI